MGFARSVADRMVFIDGGEIVEQGTPQQIFDNPQHDRTKLFLSRSALACGSTLPGTGHARMRHTCALRRCAICHCKELTYNKLMLFRLSDQEADMMQIRCQRCGWMITLGRESIAMALAEANRARSIITCSIARAAAARSKSRSRNCGDICQPTMSSRMRRRPPLPRKRKLPARAVVHRACARIHIIGKEHVLWSSNVQIADGPKN